MNLLSLYQAVTDWMSLTDSRVTQVPRARVDEMMQPIYARGDRLMSGFVLVHLLLSVLFAFAYGTWNATVVVAPLATVGFLTISHMWPRTRAVRIAAGLTLQTFVALHIYQLQGTTAMHFLSFIAFTMLIVYQDGRSMWWATLPTLLLHITLAMLQNAGANIHFYESEVVTMPRLALHLMLMLGQVAICTWWSVLLNRNTVADFLRQEEVIRSREQLRQAKQTAENASQSKSDFLASMSHEIRTPMTAILGYAELMGEEETGGSAQARGEIVRTIQRNGEHLLQIINDILDISKIEAGHMSVECIETRPLVLVDEVMQLMSVRAQQKGIELRTDYRWPIPATIQSDPVRVKQILVNLIGNAIKFTDHGSVTVRISLVNTESPKLSFEIIDSGIGMDAEQQARLFRAFSQADDTTTRKYGGTGLGLSISKKLSVLLGGDITVSSSRGRGSTFTATIATGSIAATPLLMKAEDVHRSDVATPQKTGPMLPLVGGRILLAEDGPDNQRLIAFHLTRAGAIVDVANNGLIAVEKGLAALRSGSAYDVILMDIEMPELDGYGATKMLREARYHAPIVALTAHAMAGDREKCIAAGCHDYLTKPVNRGMLIELCQSCIAKSRQNTRKVA